MGILFDSVLMHNRDYIITPAEKHWGDTTLLRPHHSHVIVKLQSHLIVRNLGSYLAANDFATASATSGRYYEQA